MKQQMFLVFVVLLLSAGAGQSLGQLGGVALPWY